VGKDENDKPKNTVHPGSETIVVNPPAQHSLRFIVTVLGLVLVLLSHHAGAQTFVQSATGTETAAHPTLTATLTNIPASGDILIAVISTPYNQGVTSISGGGATWTEITGLTNGTAAAGSMWYGTNVSGGGTAAITINLSASCYAAAVVAEYGGLAASPLDQMTNNSGTGSTPSTGTTKTTAQANELWVGGFCLHPGTGTASVGSPYTPSAFAAVNSASEDASWPQNVEDAYMVAEKVTSTGAATVSGTLNDSQSCVGMLATFKAITYAPPAMLQFGFVGSSLRLSWSQGGLLEATNATGPWI